MKDKISKIIGIINKVIVILLLLLSILNIITPFHIVNESNTILLYHVAIHHTIKRLLSFIILIIAWKLYKRVSAAWTISMIVLTIGNFQYLHLYHSRIVNPWFLLEISIYFILLLSKNYYCRKLDKYTLRKAVIIYLIYAVFVFFNAATALFIEKGVVPFRVCVQQTLDLIFDINNLNLAVFTQHALYHRFIFGFSWICIVMGLLLLLTPLISTRAQTQEEVEKAHKLVKKYGQNCSSYLTLEKDKSYLFGRNVEGFIAYGTVGDVLIVLGDPVCAPEDFLTFLMEIKVYCDKNAYYLLFLNTTCKFLKEYKKLGMASMKCGEEPRFYLPEYSIAGGKASKVRLNINHATKNGLRVLEYKPLAEKNTELEKEMEEISEEWFSIKKCSELVFTMGTIGLEEPMDKRYFYAVNAENKIEGFMVFVPYNGMNGYMADVTRHRKEATRGVMEKLFYEAMMTFKEEGIEWGSLAVSPLARLEEEREVGARVLNTVFERMDRIYGFKTLYQAKLKYNPTCWEPSYYIYFPAIFTPAMAYSIARIQNPLGIIDYVKAFFLNKTK